MSDGKSATSPVEFKAMFVGFQNKQRWFHEWGMIINENDVSSLLLFIIYYYHYYYYFTIIIVIIIMIITVVHDKNKCERLWIDKYE